MSELLSEILGRCSRGSSGGSSDLSRVGKYLNSEPYVEIDVNLDFTWAVGKTTKLFKALRQTILLHNYF